MRKYRLSTKYRGPRSDLIDYVSMSSINHYKHTVQDANLNSNLNKVYIRNFYEYHHRKRPGEGKTAKQEYDKELKEESKKQRLKDLESQISFDRTSSSFDSTEDDEHPNEEINGQINGHINGESITNSPKKIAPNSLSNGSSPNLQNSTDKDLSINGIKSKRKSTKKYNRTRTDRTSKDFFDALLSNKKLNFENEYKKCVKTCKELSLAKQIQAYQLETLTDNYSNLEDTYDDLYRKFKFINRERKLIEKDIERLKTDYCRLVKNDLIKKNNLIKENDCIPMIPIYNEIPTIDLDIMGDLKNYERAYDKYDCYVDYEEYKKLNKLNNNLILTQNGNYESLTSKSTGPELVDENNNKINIQLIEPDLKKIDLNQKYIEKQYNQTNLDEEKKKQQVNDLIHLLISRSDCSFFCNKAAQLVQENQWFKNRIKRLHIDISNEKRKNAARKNGAGDRNVEIEFEISDNLDKQKPISRNARHTINVMNGRSPGRLSNSIRAPFSSNLFTLSSRNSSVRNLSTRFSGGQPSVSLNVFEIPTKKIELFQMRLKMQNEELELQITRLKKMKQMIESKFEIQKKSLDESHKNEKAFKDEQIRLANQVKQLKIREQQLFKENVNLIRKVHQLTEQ